MGCRNNVFKANNFNIIFSSVGSESFKERGIVLKVLEQYKRFVIIHGNFVYSLYIRWLFGDSDDFFQSTMVTKGIDTCPYFSTRCVYIRFYTFHFHLIKWYINAIRNTVM